MRELPRRDSQVSSQALFGERVNVKERSGEWAQIQTPDSYSGWVLAQALTERSSEYAADLETSRLMAHLYSLPDVEYGSLLTLPFGSRLERVSDSDPRWVEVMLPDGRKGYIQKGDLTPQPFDLVPFCSQFLGLPYTWGGRSSFGFDCSGFVQMVFQRKGIFLPRDARDQFKDPRGELISLDALENGDLIFWGKEEGDIRHVGISFGNTAFIHTSSKENRPYLRVSSLLDREWSGERGVSYPFRAAKRLGRL